MSGGAYNYLSSKILKEAVEMDAWGMMKGRLTELGYARGVLREMNDLQREMQMLEDRFQVICPVLHAIEWWDSCDSGEEPVLKAIEEMNNKNQGGE